MSSSSNMLTDYIMSSRINYIYPQGTLPSNLFFRKMEKNPYWLPNLNSRIISCENKDIKLENTKVESTTKKNVKKYISTDLDREFYGTIIEVDTIELYDNLKFPQVTMGIIDELIENLE